MGGGCITADTINIGIGYPLFHRGELLCSVRRGMKVKVGSQFLRAKAERCRACAGTDAKEPQLEGCCAWAVF